MKSWILISSIAMGSVSMVGAQENSKEQNIAWTMGNQWIQEIREHYQEGSYKEVLEELDSEYRQGLAENRYDDLFNQWKGAIKEYNDLSDQGIAYRAKIDKLQSDLEALDIRTNKRLHAITKNSSDLLISEIVQERVEIQPSSAVMDPNDFIWFNDDPLAVDLRDAINEYAVKFSILRIKMFSQETASMEFNETQTAFHLERVAKLKEVLKQHSDHPMAASLAAAFDLDLAQASRAHNEEYLTSLGTKKRAPENKTEKKVSYVMADFVKKRDTILKKFSEDM